jgi:hypothetical protein
MSFTLSRRICLGIVRKIVVFGALALVFAAVPASAQSTPPPVEFSAGYNYLYFAGDDGDDGVSVPIGWYGEVAGNITTNLAIVGSVTGNYRSEEEFGVEADASFHTFAGGVRFIGRTAQANPFIHVLFGAARESVAVSFEGLDEDESDTTGVMLLGGGVNLLPAAAVGLRLGADYIRGLGDGGGNAFRFNIGINFGR